MVRVGVNVLVAVLVTEDVWVGVTVRVEVNVLVAVLVTEGV
jgi:hypothetical protein